MYAYVFIPAVLNIYYLCPLFSFIVLLPQHNRNKFIKLGDGCITEIIIITRKFHVVYL